MKLGGPTYKKVGEIVSKKQGSYALEILEIKISIIGSCQLPKNVPHLQYMSVALVPICLIILRLKEREREREKS